MIPKAFNDVDSSDIRALVTGAATETRSLEFKLEVPGNKDSDKTEFKTDVAALANSGGGDIIYGIRDDGDVAVEARGLSIPNAETEVTRLQQIVDGIEPRVRTRAKVVGGGDSGPFIFLRVEQSMGGPHAIKTSDGTYRFFARADKAKYPMSFDQIRAAFTRSASIRDQIEEFRTRRKKYHSEGIPLPLPPSPRLQVEIIPLSAFTETSLLSAADLKEASSDFSALGNNHRRMNVDGWLQYLKEDSGIAARFSQTFRNGCVEFVEAHDIRHPDDQQYRLFGPRIDGLAAGMVRLGLSFLKKIHFEPPILLYLSLVDVRGYRITTNNHLLELDPKPIDRPLIDTPEVFVETLDDLEVNVPRLIRPALDLLWQASGLSRSASYGDGGEWRGGSFL